MASLDPIKFWIDAVGRRHAEPPATRQSTAGVPREIRRFVATFLDVKPTKHDLRSLVDIVHCVNEHPYCFRAGGEFHSFGSGLLKVVRWNPRREEWSGKPTIEIEIAQLEAPAFHLYRQVDFVFLDSALFDVVPAS
jgi:hypothetical protein